MLEDRQTSWGFVLDSVVDRCSDVVWVLAAVAVGCPVELALAVVVAVFLLEYLRARAGNAGFDEVGVVTVAERPTRVIVLAPTLAVCGLVAGRCGRRVGRRARRAAGADGGGPRAARAGGPAGLAQRA